MPATSKAAPVVLVAQLQDHKRQRESWAVATLLVVEVLQPGEDGPSNATPGWEFTAVGDRLGLAGPGERLTVTGRWERTRWGLQFRVAEQVSQGITDPHAAYLWLERLDGVGPKLAGALHRRFGEDLPKILAGELEADLTEVHGIGEETAAHIRESFAELAIHGDLESIQFMASIKASRWEQGKIMQFCARRRVRPIEVLRQTPYDLMGVRGLGWGRVDRLAKAAGCARDAPARIEAAALYQLGQITDRGSTMTPMSGGRGGGLLGEVLQLLGLDDRGLARAAIHRLAARGEVVLADDNAGRTWVHPAKLLAAERVIYRAARGSASRATKQESPNRAGFLPGGSPGALPKQAPVTSRTRAVSRPANGGQCQAEPPAGEGATTPACTPPAEPTPVLDPEAPTDLETANALMHLLADCDAGEPNDW